MKQALLRSISVERYQLPWEPNSPFMLRRWRFVYVSAADGAFIVLAKGKANSCLDYLS